ncbi:hypothetical protein LCGC14_2554640, partial [marine sediment metagenome]
MYESKNVLPLSCLVNTPDRTWAILDNEITLVHHDRPGELHERPFRGIDIGELNDIYPDGESTVLFAASEGIARFDLKHLDRPARSLHAAIRSV